MTPYDYCLIAQEAYTATPDIGVVNSASRAIVRHTANGLCIAFRGSDDIASWLADLHAAPLDVPGIGWFHEGFWNAWQAMLVDTLAAIGGQSVTLVGHSLGAALALACACDMTEAGNPPAAVYAFEPPRVSPDGNVANLLAGVPLYLCRNGIDVVPEVPPLWQHAGPVHAIGKARGPITDHLIENV